jgi:hypothetical protein
MTHEEWITALVTAVAALAGGIGGSLIILLTTKWANRSANEIAQEDRANQARLATAESEERSRLALEGRQAQAKLAAEERIAQAEFAAQQRELDAQQQRDLQGKAGAAELLPLITDLRDHVPGLLVAQGTIQRSDSALKARDAFRRGVATTVPLLTNHTLMERCRTLQRLIEQVQSRGQWPEGKEDRVRAEVQRYATYVLHSLIRFMHDRPLPDDAPPPHLNRNPNDGHVWSPDVYSQEYEDLL